MEEIWKDIIGLEGYYMISNVGNIKSLAREVSNGKSTRVIEERILNPGLNAQGYYSINLTKDNKLQRKLVHRLIAIHFIDNPNGLPHVNHRDGIRTNNSIDNLEWVTSRENACHGANSGKYVGVTFSKRAKKWQSNIFVDKKLKHIGYFLTLEEAYEARVKYELDNNIKNKYL